MKPAPSSLRSQAGVSLIEALIALLLLSVGVLGMAALHGRAIQYAVDAEDRNRAATLANEVIGLMWAQRSVALPTATVTAWQSRVTSATASGLPNAAGAISSADSNGLVTVTITWRPPSRPSGEGDFKYVTKVRLP